MKKAHFINNIETLFYQMFRQCTYIVCIMQVKKPKTTAIVYKKQTFFNRYWWCPLWRPH